MRLHSDRVIVIGDRDLIVTFFDHITIDVRHILIIIHVAFNFMHSSDMSFQTIDSEEKIIEIVFQRNKILKKIVKSKYIIPGYVNFFMTYRTRDLVVQASFSGLTSI